MRHILYLSAILSGLFLTSCYRTFDMEDYRTTPKMVINSAFSPDTVVMASISRTWFHSESMPDVTLRNAKVELYIDGIFKEEMPWKEYAYKDTLYISTTVPQPGQTVKIVASTPEYGTATAEDVIPSKTEIKDLQIIPRKEATGNGSTIIDQDGNITYTEENDVLLYQITFQDTPGKSNYYSLQIWGNDDQLGVLLDFSVDPVFTQQQGILDEVFGSSMVNWRGRVFSDELFDGKVYTLQVKEQIRLDMVNSTKRHIRLYSLSESYYQYLLSLQNIDYEGIMGGLTNVGLAEPVRIYSNVEGGTGIAGGCQWVESLIDLKDLIK